MNTTLAGVAVATALMSSATASAAPRADVDFAVGGATTNSFNATDAFAAQDPNLAALLGLVRASGLDLIGLEQQLDFAAATLNDVEPEKDLFWVYAGTNNYLAGGTDPAVAAGELGAALERLYAEVGARRFVVPNLPPLGNLPVFAAFPQGARDGLNMLTAGHNATLGAVLDGFRASHPDTEVIPVDVFSEFLAHAASGDYADVINSCQSVIPAADLTTPNVCDSFLYLDSVHPASSSWAPVAKAVADAVSSGQVDGISTRGAEFGKKSKKAKKVRRIITLGDSFSDLGSLSDTFTRALPFPFAFPPPPFTEGRFTEAENVVQQTEERLGTKVRSTFFAQPFSTTETVAITGENTLLSMTGSVIVPKQLTVVGTTSDAVEVTFGANVSCWYDAVGENTFANPCCTQDVEGGDRIQAGAISVTTDDDAGTITIDWLHY